MQTSPGQSVTLTLEARPGAGLVWCPPPAPPDGWINALAATAIDAGAGAATGGPVHQHFALGSDSPGCWQLHFEFRRPWQTDVRARQTVVLTVVAPASAAAK